MHSSKTRRFSMLSALCFAGLATLTACDLTGNLTLENGEVKAELDFNLRADGFVQETLDSFAALADSAASSVSQASYTTVGSTTVGVLETLPPDADVVFAVDNTGSMGWAIDQVKAEVVDAMKKEPGRRYGVIAYRDRGDSFVTKSLSSLPDGLDAAVAGIGMMTASEGGDFPESVAEGLNEALTQPWSATAERHIILIGDAPDHEYTDTTVTMESVGAKAKSMNVVIHAIGVPCNDVCKGEIGAL